MFGDERGRKRRSDHRLVDIAGVVRIDREKAMLLYDGKHSEWVPKSQIEDNGDGTFTMPLWLAKEKGFI